MFITILYGITNNYSDITRIAHFLSVNDIITIPANDVQRAILFGDPQPNILKHILIRTVCDGIQKETIYKNNQEIVIDFSKYNTLSKKYICDHSISDAKQKLNCIHNNVRLKYGNFWEEYPEQLMTATYLDKNSKVLELGGNIGRNTLVIATILENDKNLVTLEPHPEIVKQLEHNKEINMCTFNIENAALSYRKLIQKGWASYPGELVIGNNQNEFININIITFEELEKKYDIIFDTIIADCEGALYYILQDNPNILDNIKLFIMENDYQDINHKNFVDDLLKEKHFERIYFSGLGWGPCKDFFYEVWKKN